MNTADIATFDRFRATRYFGALDALRCLSILAVIWHHTAAAHFAHIPLLTRGHLGVTLFFAISGFLITTLLLRERETRGDISLRLFYIRRTLRIFPLYYTVIALYVAVVWLMERHTAAGGQFHDNLPYFLTYTSNWFVRLDGQSERVIFYFAWSLATEEQFYLVWPWVEKYARRGAAPAVMITALASVFAVHAGWTDAWLTPGSLPHIVVGSIAPAIGLGVVLAHVLNDRRGFGFLAPVLGRRWSPVALLGVLAVLLALPRTEMALAYEAAVVLVMTMLVGSMVIREDHVLSRWCGIGIVRHIGVVSYGMYLLHMLASNAAGKAMGAAGVSHPVLRFAAAGVGAYVAAAISHRFYESWFLRLKDRFGRPAPAAAGHDAGSGDGPLPTIALRGVRLHAITESQCVDHILAELDARRGGWVVTPNLDHLRRLVKDSSFATLCRGASLLVADGMPLVWASRLQGTPLPQRVAGSNLISSLSAAASSRGRSVFLLGGDPGSAEQAAEVLRRRHPSLRVAGHYCPPMGFERNPQEMQRIREAIADARPEIVFVALGSPKQERLIADLRAQLPGTWWLGVGISFSFLCGQVRRAPQWMQHCGLEWVHRLMQEPRRLARRYLVDGLPFGLWLLAGAVAARRSAAVKLGNV